MRIFSGNEESSSFLNFPLWQIANNNQKENGLKFNACLSTHILFICKDFYYFDSNIVMFKKMSYITNL